MKYRDLPIQTQREFPNNARTEGFGWLVRAGYASRENELTALGEFVVNHLRSLATTDVSSFFFRLSLSTINAADETFFPISTGDIEIIHCPACGYTSRRELAIFKKTPFSNEKALPAEKVFTPECPTIESLAAFLNVPKEGL